MALLQPRFDPEAIERMRREILVGIARMAQASDQAARAYRSIARDELLTRLRGKTYGFRTAVLVPTFHPAFLLRNPGQEFKRMAWDDLKLARREYDARATDGGRTDG